jgi:cytochrome c6
MRDFPRAPVWSMALASVALIGLSAAAGQAASDDVDEETLELGREVFLEHAQPPCGICHTLADAETRVTIAPRLDLLQPTAEEVREALIDGPGAMPSYAETLSEEEIDAVSQYVAAVSGAE